MLGEEPSEGGRRAARFLGEDVGGWPAERAWDRQVSCSVSFDFVFATSVFTHMLPAAIDRYVSDVARVLRPGGRFFTTAFLWTADTAARAERGKLKVDFPLDFGSYRTASSVLEAVVAYDERYLLDQLQAHGLRQLGDVHTGSWAS